MIWGVKSKSCDPKIQAEARKVIELVDPTLLKSDADASCSPVLLTKGIPLIDVVKETTQPAALIGENAGLEVDLPAPSPLFPHLEPQKLFFAAKLRLMLRIQVFFRPGSSDAHRPYSFNGDLRYKKL